MKVVIFAAGSRGDIQPCLLLARGLKKSGYSPLIAAPENYSAFIAEYDVDFFPLQGDIQEIMKSETGRKFMGKKGSNPISSILAMRKLVEPIAVDMVHGAYEACRDADALICLSIFHPFGKAIAEKSGIAYLCFEPAPLLPTRDFPSPSWPVQKPMGKLLNLITGRIMMYVVWLWFSPFVSSIRKEWKLLPETYARNLKSLFDTPLVCAYSSCVLPRPSDWPNNFHMTGYLFPEDNKSLSLPAELQSFIDNGSPPVYIGFGSMETSEPEKLLRIIYDALAQTGKRGIIAGSWSEDHPLCNSGDILHIEKAPHSRLFPQMSVLVHHGGAGTTAQGLRSGIPSVIVPFAFDQFFWGRMLEKMGLGPEPIPVKKLTSDRLAIAIEKASNDNGMREKALFVKAELNAEESLRNAIAVIERYIKDKKSEKLHSEKER